MFIICFSILLLFFNFCHKNLHIFAIPSSAVLKPAQAGLVYIQMCSRCMYRTYNHFAPKINQQNWHLFVVSSDKLSFTEFVNGKIKTFYEFEWKHLYCFVLLKHLYCFVLFEIFSYNYFITISTRLTIQSDNDQPVLCVGKRITISLKEI